MRSTADNTGRKNKTIHLVSHRDNIQKTPKNRTEAKQKNQIKKGHEKNQIKKRD
jgi:hypothetical protein